MSNNIEALSDVELNKLVAITTGHSQLSTLGWQGTQEDGSSAVIVKGPRTIGAFDPCNRPEQAWPIIIANKISIEWRDSLRLPPCAKRSGDTRFWVAHDNPLRAAMCVFLIMQEANNG